VRNAKPTGAAAAARQVMGEFATPPAVTVAAWTCTALIIALNVLLIVQYFNSAPAAL